MKEITKIVVQSRDKKRSNVYLDGEFYCGLDNFVILSNRLKVGDFIEQEQFEQIVEQSEFLSAFDRALNYISHYKKTKKQMEEYLKAKGYIYTTIFKVIEKLCSYGYLDDLEYANYYISLQGEKKGKLLIENELKLKGVSQKNIDKAFENFNGENESCKKVAIKYMKNKQPTYENVGKCYRYLLSKGFNYESVENAVDFIKKDYDNNDF